MPTPPRMTPQCRRAHPSEALAAARGLDADAMGDGGRTGPTRATGVAQARTGSRARTRKCTGPDARPAGCARAGIARRAPIGPPVPGRASMEPCARVGGPHRRPHRPQESCSCCPSCPPPPLRSMSRSATSGPWPAGEIRGLAWAGEDLLVLDARTGRLALVDPATDDTRVVNDGMADSFVGAGGLALDDGVAVVHHGRGLHRAPWSGRARAPGPARLGRPELVLRDARGRRPWPSRQAGSTSCAGAPSRSGTSPPSMSSWPGSTCTASASRGSRRRRTRCGSPTTWSRPSTAWTRTPWPRGSWWSPPRAAHGHRRPARARRRQRHPARGLLRERAVPQGQPVGRPVLGGPLPRPGPDPPAARAPRPRGPAGLVHRPPDPDALLRRPRARCRRRAAARRRSGG